MMHPFEFDAIGTSWQIESSEPLCARTREEIVRRVDAFDSIFSRFRKDSLVSNIAAAERGGTFVFPDEAGPLFALYDRLHALTDGAVDPLVGRDLELLGYDADYSLRPKCEAIAAYSRERRAWPMDVRRQGATITTKRSVVLDVGAAGKGLLADIVASTLMKNRFGEFVVDAGGDLVHRGASPLEVGLEDPVDAGLVVGAALLRNQSLCASAVNRRAWAHAHHVIDGRTGVPTREVIATWAVANDAMTADGLATALFFVPAAALGAGFDFTSVRVFADGRGEVDPRFAGEVFVA